MSESFEHGDRLYRSHFLNADQLARRTERVVERGRPALADQVEKDAEGGWLNVRVGDGEWASVRELRPVPADRMSQGRIRNAPAPGEAANVPSYADRLADGMDPTAPDSPESRF